MKREYFGMLFLVAFASLIMLAGYLLGEQVWDYLNKYIVIWILIAYYAGQYSMKFPKAL